jgi:hypothetical protein
MNIHFVLYFFRIFLLQVPPQMQTYLTGSSSCIIMVIDAESRVHNIIVHFGLFAVSGVASKVSSRHVTGIMQQMLIIFSWGTDSELTFV